MRKLLLVGLWIGMACPLLRAQEQKQDAGANINAYIEMLRSDVRTHKTALIGQAIPMTDKESAAFWPVYRKYDAEMAKLGDERLTIIKDYAAHYDKMNDEKARELGNRTLAWEEKRVKLKKQYFEEFNKVLPAMKAAKLIQFESRINLLIDLQIASEVPPML